MQKTHQRLPRFTALLIISHCWYFTPAGECRRRPGSQQLSWGMIDICGYFTLSPRPEMWLYNELLLLLSPTRVAAVLLCWSFWYTFTAGREGGLVDWCVFECECVLILYTRVIQSHTKCTHTSCRWPSWHILTVLLMLPLKSTWIGGAGEEDEAG